MHESMMLIKHHGLERDEAMFAAPSLNSTETKILNRIEELNTDLRNQLRQPPRWTGQLRRMTLARNVQGSNSIEGIHASVDDINAIEAGEKPATLSTETEQALAGYQAAMTYVLQLAKSDFDLNPMLLRSLHFMTTQHELDKWPGRFREGPVYVQQERTGDIVYEGAPSERVPDLITQLCAGHDQKNPDLINAAMLHLNFVLVHPFKDGNGRMARILQSLAVASSGEYAPIFLTIEEYLGRRTQQYYDVLATVGQGNWSTADYAPERARPWVQFILTAHLNQAHERQHRFEAMNTAVAGVLAALEAASLNERCEHALYISLLGGTVTRARYMAALAENGEHISEQSATRDLAALDRAGLLNAQGDRRGRFYTRSDMVRQIGLDAGLGYAWKDSNPFV